MNDTSPQPREETPDDGQWTLLDWHLVQLKPNAEAMARRNLERQGVRIFAPFETRMVKRGRKQVMAPTLLFPGYFFIHFDPEEVRWRSLNSTLGVARVVCFPEGQPARVPTEIMTSLAIRCGADGQLLPPCDLKAGDDVRIAAGPLVDFVGTVERMAPGQRVWVLLEIMGGPQRVEIRTADVRRP